MSMHYYAAIRIASLSIKSSVLLEDKIYVGKSKPLISNITRKESTALKSIKDA
jgi:hypothetical protein